MLDKLFQVRVTEEEYNEFVKMCKDKDSTIAIQLRKMIREKLNKMEMIKDEISN